MHLFFAFIVIKNKRNLQSPIWWYGYAFGKARAKIMRTGHNESGHNEKHSLEDEHVETLERKPAQISNIPPRASAHPSAHAAVRPKYLHSVSDQQRITPFDGVSSDPIGLTGSTQRRTEDLLTEHIFHNTEDIVPIDEMDTFPPDAQARLRPASKRSAYESVSQVDTVPISCAQGKQAEIYPPVGTRSWGELPNGIRQRAQPQGFSIEHYIDNVRWWLLFPGRLEFLLWLSGAIVLVFLTSFFLLVITTVWIR
jgi:hypothetical protein